MIPPGFGLTVLYGALAGAATFAGILAVLRSERWAARHMPHLLAFASGVLVAGALLHVLTEAGELAGPRSALLAVVLSFAAFATIEMQLNAGVRRRRVSGEAGARPMGGSVRRSVALGAVAPLGLLVHSALDGVVLGVGVLARDSAWILLLVVVAHEIPEGLASITAQLHGGVSRRTAFWRAAAVALATPVAAVIGHIVLRDAADALLGILLGVGAGSFLYVGAVDLLPESEHDSSFSSLLSFLAGVLLMLVVEWVAHS